MLFSNTFVCNYWCTYRDIWMLTNVYVCAHTKGSCYSQHVSLTRSLETEVLCLRFHLGLMQVKLSALFIVNWPASVTSTWVLLFKRFLFNIRLSLIYGSQTYGFNFTVVGKKEHALSRNHIISQFELDNFPGWRHQVHSSQDAGQWQWAAAPQPTTHPLEKMPCMTNLGCSEGHQLCCVSRQ